MIKNKALPIGTIFIILVIALALVGVGYAFWSETLTISGTVQTGEVDVQFSTYDPVECVDTQAGLCQPEPSEKADAANCTVTQIGSTDPNDNGVSKLVVTATGMYPSWHCKVSFDVTSTGNVPVHVELPKPVGDIPVWVATDLATCYTNNVQLEQTESTGKCTLDIHFTNAQAPEENSIPYTFGWTILAKQWNEEPDVITVTSSMLDFGPTGWGGWSCPADHKYVVGGTTNCALALTSSQWAKPGVGMYPVYPHYTYTAPETGWVVQNGAVGQSCQILVDCSTAP